MISVRHLSSPLVEVKYEALSGIGSERRWPAVKLAARIARIASHLSLAQNFQTGSGRSASAESRYLCLLCTGCVNADNDTVGSFK